MIQRKKPQFTLVNGVPRVTLADSNPAPAPTPPPQIPATTNSSSSTPTTVIFWGYWKESGEEIAIAGATATSPVTGVTSATSSPGAQTPTTQATTTPEVSQGSFLYKVSPIGATGVTA